MTYQPTLKVFIFWSMINSLAHSRPVKHLSVCYLRLLHKHRLVGYIRTFDTTDAFLAAGRPTVQCSMTFLINITHCDESDGARLIVRCIWSMTYDGRYAHKQWFIPASYLDLQTGVPAWETAQYGYSPSRTFRYELSDSLLMYRCMLCYRIKCVIVVDSVADPSTEHSDDAKLFIGEIRKSAQIAKVC
jgi:hypothetical protein